MSRDEDHMLIQAYHPCHMTTSTNPVPLMVNISSNSAFASGGKLDTAQIKTQSKINWQL